MGKSYWLLKSEPNVWSIEQQKEVGPNGIAWDGVRNYQAANNLKINSVIAVTVIPDPFCLHSDRNKYRKFRTSLKRFSPILNFWAGKMYPKQVFQHKNDSTLFSPGWRTLALGKTGMISQNPWIQGGGNSDFVFESDFEFIKISKGRLLPS